MESIAFEDADPGRHLRHRETGRDPAAAHLAGDPGLQVLGVIGLFAGDLPVGRRGSLVVVVGAHGGHSA
ncbi:hypothetical protein [Streptomyces sp. NBC_00696]|uniref:hypothetical protein n=1 Tax=Streptomyces sp. NBC_00696 TaxID=2903672 RepID=UPI002E320D4B|nr:hypothetical protein [Streptomyces sp. NBC_00696]